jgi:hypothetical protein
MTTKMNGALAATVEATIATADKIVLRDLPETVQTDFGEHDVWYAQDDDGLYACIETGDLLPTLWVSEFDDRDNFPLIGWRVDLEEADAERLEALGRDVADHRQ